MERKHSAQPHSIAKSPSVLGSLVFTIFHLILLSILSWVLLEAWLTIQIFTSDIRSTHLTIQNIVTNNIHITMHYHPRQSDSALEFFHRLNNIINSWCNGNIRSEILEILIGGVQVSITRFILFIEFTPFMIAIFFISIIDGLVQRDKRKYQGARESTLLFHRLKPLAKISLLTMYFVYMLLPYAIQPMFYLIPMTIASSLFTMLSIKNFKKYL